MQVTRLSVTPSTKTLQLIRTCAKDIAPDDEKLSEWHTKYCTRQAPRIALDLDMVLERIPRQARILEFGSIPLLLTVALARSGFDVRGCDLAPHRYSTVIKRLGLNVFSCDIETQALPCTDDCYDAIIFNELFEHLRINPIFTLGEVLRVLKPGGTLMLSSPNLRSFNGLKNFLLHNKAYSNSADIFKEYTKLQTIGHMGHVREYTTREVSEFLSAIGFEISTVIFRGDYENKLSKAIIRLIPALSPFVTYFATKP